MTLNSRVSILLSLTLIRFFISVFFGYNYSLAAYQMKEKGVNPSSTDILNFSFIILLTFEILTSERHESYLLVIQWTMDVPIGSQLTALIKHKTQALLEQKKLPIPFSHQNRFSRMKIYRKSGYKIVYWTNFSRCPRNEGDSSAAKMLLLFIVFYFVVIARCSINNLFHTRSLPPLTWLFFYFALVFVSAKFIDKILIEEMFQVLANITVEFGSLLFPS